jgi:hypothetical protein
MDRVTEQADRSGQDGKQQFDDASCSQSHRADGHRLVGLVPVPGVIARPGQRERCRRVTNSGGLMHLARLAVDLAHPLGA